MAEILEEFEGYDEYFVKDGQLVPVSTKTLAKDVIFDDGSSLEDVIESLKTHGTDVKDNVASAVSMIGDFTETDATYETIKKNLVAALEDLVNVQIFSYAGEDIIYEIPATGDYLIVCGSPKTSSGKYGSYFSGEYNFKVGTKVMLRIGHSTESYCTGYSEILFLFPEADGYSNFLIVDSSDVSVDDGSSDSVTNEFSKLNCNSLGGYVRIKCLNIDE